VLPATSWPRILEHIGDVVTAVNALRPGDFVELTFGRSDQITILAQLR